MDSLFERYVAAAMFLDIARRTVKEHPDFGTYRSPEQEDLVQKFLERVDDAKAFIEAAAEEERA